MMTTKSFLGPLTAITAAGTQPLGSVFNAVPSADYLLGWDVPLIPPPVRPRRSRQSARDDYAAAAALPCGCGA
jgi:hypothetical protein